MLFLLLDEHISVAVASELRRKHPRFPVLALPELESGNFLGLPDHLLLEHAAARGLTLVTYDRKTIPPLLKTWSERGCSHGGVIFIDEKTIPPADFGRLIRALELLFDAEGAADWTNRVIFLQRNRDRHSNS